MALFSCYFSVSRNPSPCTLRQALCPGMKLTGLSIRLTAREIFLTRLGMHISHATKSRDFLTTHSLSERWVNCSGGDILDWKEDLAAQRANPVFLGSVRSHVIYLQRGSPHANCY